MTHASEFARLHAEIYATPYRDRVNHPGAFYARMSELARHGAEVKASILNEISLPEPNWVSFVSDDAVTVTSGALTQTVTRGVVE